MAAQIPLPWQLTDALCALGLGFAFGAAYLPLCLVLPARGSARRRRRRRFVRDAVWTFACALFLQAWVLTGSHAAQLRWSMLLAAAVGCGAFRRAALPILARLGAWQRRVWGRPAAAFRRLREAGRARRAARRAAAKEKKAAAAKARADAKAASSAANGAKGAHRGRFAQKIFEKNTKKQLQIPPRVYYNNL